MQSIISEVFLSSDDARWDRISLALPQGLSQRCPEEGPGGTAGLLQRQRGGGGPGARQVVRMRPTCGLPAPLPQAPPGAAEGDPGQAGPVGTPRGRRRSGRSGCHGLHGAGAPAPDSCGLQAAPLPGLLRLQDSSASRAPLFLTAAAAAAPSLPRPLPFLPPQVGAGSGSAPRAGLHRPSGSGAPRLWGCGLLLAVIFGAPWGPLLAVASGLRALIRYLPGALSGEAPLQGTPMAPALGLPELRGGCR